MTVWTVEVGRPPGFLLASAHLTSKNQHSECDQGMLAVEVAKEIVRVEDEVGHQRTVFVGDLNMNPFEMGLTSAMALHAVMTTDLAKRSVRVVDGKSYRFFYNPMWGFFGDRTSGPPGTYFHQSSKPVECFWHMFDQLLLRPKLAECLADVRILDRIGGKPLITVKKGRPSSKFSDHLPLAFSLNLE
jgi:hypothetical protein